MNDETPLDLQLLDPEETPDVVQGAIRRFRWRVVLGTVVTVIAATSLTAWGMAAYLESNETQARSRRLSAAQLAIYDASGASSCATPTFTFDGVEIGLLQLAPMPGGGWAIHLVAHGDRPFATGTGRFMAAGAVAPEARYGQFAAQPGMTWAEAWVSIPRSAGDPFDVEIRDTDGEVVGTFLVRTSDFRCDFS